MSTLYIANLLERLPYVGSTRMVHSGIGVWIAWNGQLDPAFESMLEDYGGFRMAETSGQALWFFFGDEGIKALARIHVWGRVNAMPVFVEVFPASMLVSPKFEKSLSLSVELSRQNITPGESLDILLHPNFKAQLARIPGLSCSLAKPPSGLARVPFERLEAEPGLSYESGLSWLSVIRPLGDPLKRGTAEGWHNIAVELLAIIERMGLKYLRHEGFLIFEIGGLRLFRTWCRETLAHIQKLKAEGDQGHYWPSVMASVSSKGRSLGKDLPRRLALDWDQMTPDLPLVSYRSAFLLGGDFVIHEARTLSRGATVEDWCNVSLGRVEEDEAPQGAMAVPLPAALSGGGANACFYCGLNNHAPRECPSKLLVAPCPEAWDRFGMIDLGRLEEVSQGLEAAFGDEPLPAMVKSLSGKDEKDVLLQTVFEIDLAHQLRMFEIVCRSKARELPVVASQIGPREGDFFWEALTALREGSAEAYEVHLAQALARYPRSYQPKALQGFAAMEAGDWTKAVYYWQESVRLCYTALQRGYFHYLQGRAMEIQGDFHKAIALYRESLRDCPKWTEPLYRQGVCLVKMGFTDQGLQYFYQLVPNDANMFNRVMVDPELERGRLHVLAALWKKWEEARLEAAVRLTTLSALGESLRGHFLEGEPYLVETLARIKELAKLGQVANFVAYKRLGAGTEAMQEEVAKKITSEIKAMQQHQERQFGELKDVQREAAWFPFPTLLREFNRDFNYCANKLNWMRTSPMDEAANFHKSREYLPLVDERIQTLRTRLITLRIVRDSTYFAMLLGRNFLWMEVVGLGLSLVIVPVMVYVFQRYGQGWVADLMEQQKWQLQKGLVVILSIAAMALAAINTALTFEAKKRKLFKLADEGKLPVKKSKSKKKGKVAKARSKAPAAAGKPLPAKAPPASGKNPVAAQVQAVKAGDPRAVADLAKTAAKAVKK